MKEELKKAFIKSSYIPKGNLTSEIWNKIAEREKRWAQFRLAVVSIIGGISLAGLIPAFRMLSADLAQSGFYEYLSLAFSSGTLLNYWKEFSLSILESLPTVSMIISLSLVFIFFLSLKNITKQIIKSQSLLSF